MACELLNLTEVGRYLNVSAERARQVSADDQGVLRDHDKTNALMQP